MMIIVAKRILLLSLDVCRHASVYNAVAKSPRQWRSEGLTPSLSLTHFVGIFVTYRSVIVDGQVAFSSELPSPSLLSQPHKVVDLVPVGYTCTGISLPYTGTSTYTDGEWISLDLGRGRALECLGFALRSSEVCFKDYVCVCVCVCITDHISVLCFLLIIRFRWIVLWISFSKRVTIKVEWRGIGRHSMLL